MPELEILDAEFVDLPESREDVLRRKYREQRARGNYAFTPVNAPPVSKPPKPAPKKAAAKTKAVATIPQVRMDLLLMKAVEIGIQRSGDPVLQFASEVLPVQDLLTQMFGPKR